MIKRPVKLGLSQFPRSSKFCLKILLGVFVLGFFLEYQPTLNFPPQRKPAIYAQTEQTQTIQAESLPFAPLLPHPGYLSTRYSSFHPAVDIATGLGMPIHPIAKGIVVGAGFNFWGLGLTVSLEHENGYKSLYAHMGKTYVTAGQIVNPEDTLGEVGLTGQTSGPHTHLEISKDGKTIDPLALLPKIDDIPKPEFLTPIAGYIAPISTPGISTISSSSPPTTQPTQVNLTVSQTINTVNETKTTVTEKINLTEQIKQSL